MYLVHVNEATANRRRVYFDLRGPDGITAVTSETGGQPQIAVNGAAWSNVGIGTLTAIGNGRYYADLTQAILANAGDRIETRYKSANTTECPGDSVQVTVLDLYDAAALGMTRLDAAVSTRSTYAGGAADANILAVKAKTDNLPASPAAVSDIPTAAAITAAVLAGVVEGSISVLQGLRILLAFAAGKSIGTDAAGTAKFKSLDGTKDRITQTIDSGGNRTANPTLDGS